MKRNIFGLNKWFVIAVLILLLTKTIYVNYFDEGLGLARKYVRNADSVREVVGRVDSVGYRRYVKAKDFESGLFRNEYMFIVGGENGWFYVTIYVDHVDEDEKKLVGVGLLDIRKESN